MKQNTYLFLDFDGVICDSVAETYVTSWVAFFAIKGEQPSSVSLKGKELYYSLRPFIRDADDYLVLHYCVEHNINLASQEDFDSLSAGLGEELLSQFHGSFYKGRQSLMEKDRKYWLSLQPLYPIMKEIIPKLAAHSHVHILSTKQSHIISVLLSELGCPWPDHRIHYAKGRGKLVLLTRFLDEHPGSQAVFIEDQIDNIKNNGDKRVIPYLASWGYLRDEWRDQDEVPLIGEKGFLNLAMELLDSTERLRNERLAHRPGFP
jgi:hypothetical protein